MNGAQIENVLELIDTNIALTRAEATEYIREHRVEVAESLAKSGTAKIPTSAGELQLTVADLKAAAA